MAACQTAAVTPRRGLHIPLDSSEVSSEVSMTRQPDSGRRLHREK